MTSSATSRDRSPLYQRRRTYWRQTLETRIPDATAAAAFIDQVSIATLYPASPEIPNLFHAFTGDPAAQTDSGHSSPSGQVYGWRWDLGRAQTAFYSTIVRRRPTWVSWYLLPAVLRLLAETQTPDELADLGVISPGAYRIAQALESAEGALSTGELRRAAGFPTGKEQRSAYLKAVDELESRLLLAKVFSTDDHDMHHALTTVQYREYCEAAEQMTREEALDEILISYLPHAIYAVPDRLAKHLRLSEAELCVALERLEVVGRVTEAVLPFEKAQCYVWVQ